ncbi:MAG TPA: arsenic resistance N-acetyltransferase ArsN2 [Thermoanaerobaculia bacterium]|nr:arsenic resistance N-acetyltransferase ArsN2 [Thermoanaerobaculia bacterium]
MSVTIAAVQLMKSISELSISGAVPEDLDAVHALLTSAALPVAGVEEHFGTFVVARDGDRIVACGGAEAHQFVALIRSIAVAPDYRGIGLGRRMVRELLDRLASRGLREFYLLTTDAEGYFRKRGFKTIDRDEVHPQLLGSAELQGACPSTAACMRLVMT